MDSVLRRAAFRYGQWNRGRKLQLARKVAASVGAKRVLIVGVSPTSEGPVNNLIEDALRSDHDFVVGSGLSGPDVVWDRFVVADGRCLPFADDSFDMVFSNAVIEHVGGREDQQRFVDECVRVARCWLITTPNRTFPVEAHEHTLFRHWRAGWAPTHSSVTRLLGPEEFRELFPEGTRILGRRLISPTLAAVGRRT